MEKASPTQTQKNEDAEDADDDDDGDAKKYALPSMINSEWRPADGNGEAISEASWKSDLFTNSCMEIEQKTGERILERDYDDGDDDRDQNSASNDICYYPLDKEACETVFKAAEQTENLHGRLMENATEVCERDINTSKHREDVKGKTKDVVVTMEMRERDLNEFKHRKDVTVEGQNVLASADLCERESNAFTHGEDIILDKDDVHGPKDVCEPELNAFKHREDVTVKRNYVHTTEDACENDSNVSTHRKDVGMERNNVLATEEVCKRELNTFKNREDVTMKSNDVSEMNDACERDSNTATQKEDVTMKKDNVFVTEKVCEIDFHTFKHREDLNSRSMEGNNVLLTKKMCESREDVIGRSMEEKIVLESSGVLQQSNLKICGIEERRAEPQNILSDMCVMQERLKEVHASQINTPKQIEDVPRSMEGNNVCASVGLHQADQDSINACGSTTVLSIRSDKVSGIQIQNLESFDLDGKDETDTEDKDEDEDEEDVDFNPFLLHSPSPEASSGLSSESEDLEDENESEGVQNHRKHEESGFLEAHQHNYMEEEEYVNNADDHTDKPSSIGCISQDSKDTESYFNCKTKAFQVGSHFQMESGDEGVFLESNHEEETYTLHSKDLTTLSNLSGSSRNEVLDMGKTVEENLNEEEQVADAICRRTRAHYSLADMSLDELETFLQESDEEDYFQNVDDEEEYRKFVAAVQGCSMEGIGVNNQGCGKKAIVEEEEEEDEEDDYDFEIELEEALESDYEEKCEEEVRKRKRQSGTGQKKEKRNDRERLLGSAKTPLRPLLPCGVLNDASNDTDKFLNVRLNNGKSKSYGFTPCQRGQLQSLLHEHVQLLVQVLSLTVLDPSRQQIAVDTQKILVQLVETREQILSWKKPPFPEVCLCPPHVHASTSIIQPHPFTSDHGKTVSDGRYTESNSSKYAAVQGPIRSLIDVPSLALVKDFIADMARAVEVFKQKRVQGVYDCKELARKPLFPMPAIQDAKISVQEPHQPKKTMAGALVYHTKLNGIALVPREISMIVSRFTPLFNPDMFPHKPPPAALAKRLLFSEAEDELLAMGIMSYNTNWEKIQQNLLPPKTTHQIFVRQKNRSTSKAPENSIKAVRRLKSSPLTKEEQALIEEGLKVFKNDWTKVCEQCVPYRDPATLSRLWRAALGIQKSYSLNSEAKAKHRRNKKSNIAHEDDDTGEVNSGDETGGESADVYLHEAFLTECNPNEGCSSAPKTNLGSMTSTLPVPQSSSGSSLNIGVDPTCSHVNYGSAQVNMKSSSFVPNNFTSRERLLETGISSRVAKGKHQVSLTNTNKTFRRTVKLAPGLPSLNLPPCVRVIPQATFNKHALDGSCGGGTKIHKLTVVRNTSLMRPRQDSLTSGSYVSEHGVSMSRSSCLHGTSRDSSELGGSTGGRSSIDPSTAKMHPLLMKGTFESGIQSENTTLYKVVSGQALPQDVPRFRPFLSASKGKSVLSARTGSKESVAAELHPFLLEDADYQSGLLNTIRDTVHQSVRDAVHQTVSDTVHQTIRDTVHQIGSMIQYHNHVGGGHQEWPSVLSDSVIRPEPRRAVQVSYRQGDFASAVEDQEKHNYRMKDLISGSNNEIQLSNPKKNHVNGDMSWSLHERQKGNAQLVQLCEEENIIMEQEELSDSEEDTDLGVQFEYEEIDDSERESSDNEICGTDKGDEGIEFEEEEIGSDDSDDDVE